MKAIAYLTLAAATFLMVATLGPDFVTTVIGLDKEDIGFIVAPAGAGVLTGVLTVGRVVRRYDRSAVIDAGLVGAGAMIILIAMTKPALDLLWPGGAPVAVAAAFTAFFASLLGIANAFILVPAQTMLQERSHEHIRARVYATFFTISNTVSFVPIFFAAAFADLFGVVQVLIVVGGLIGSIGIVSVVERRSAEAARWQRVPTRHRQGPEALIDEQEN